MNFKRPYSLISFILFSLFNANVLAKNYSNLAEFGTNPGELSAKYYLPKQQANALIVLLHGCTQNGVELAKDSGLLFHAQINNLALLVPQQSQNNNIQSCFNWFSPQDITKDEGETYNMILLECFPTAEPC